MGLCGKVSDWWACVRRTATGGPVGGGQRLVGLCGEVSD